MRDPYEVLGLTPQATDEEVKSAFRKLASRHHPDKNPGDAAAPERFKEINAAYQILSDPQKRAAWDRYGAAAFGGGGGGVAPGGGAALELHALDRTSTPTRSHGAVTP